MESRFYGVPGEGGRAAVRYAALRQKSFQLPARTKNHRLLAKSEERMAKSPLRSRTRSLACNQHKSRSRYTWRLNRVGLKQRG
jgi:hypothetical protein